MVREEVEIKRRDSINALLLAERIDSYKCNESKNAGVEGSETDRSLIFIEFISVLD